MADLKKLMEDFYLDSYENRRYKSFRNRQELSREINLILTKLKTLDDLRQLGTDILAMVECQELHEFAAEHKKYLEESWPEDGPFETDGRSEFEALMDEGENLPCLDEIIGKVQRHFKCSQDHRSES